MVLGRKTEVQHLNRNLKKLGQKTEKVKLLKETQRNKVGEIEAIDKIYKQKESGELIINANDSYG